MVGEGVTEDELLIRSEVFRGGGRCEGKAAEVYGGELGIERVGGDQGRGGAPSSLLGLLEVGETLEVRELGESGLRKSCGSEGGSARSREHGEEGICH